jgi:HlyD family secretion protein
MSALPSSTSGTQTPPRREDILAVLQQGQKRRRVFAYAGATLLLAVAIGGYVWWQRRSAEPERLRFQTSPVSLGTLHETVTATGTLNPVDSVQLGAEVTGKLVTVNVDVNDEVKVGQVLAEIDPEQLRARLQEATASLSSAFANQRNAEASHEEAVMQATRLEALFGRGLAPQQELENATAAVSRANASLASAKAQITLAQAGVTAAKTALNKAVIVAPISGVVLARNVEPGQTLTAGFQTPVLFTLGRSLGELELKVEVDEADIGKVQEGQSATFSVDAYPNRPFRAELVKLHNLPTKVEGVTSTVVTYSAVLTVSNPERLLRPGMTATATITTRTMDNVLMLPNTALRFEPPRTTPSQRGFLPFPGMRGGMRPPVGKKPEPKANKGMDQVWIEDGALQKPVVVEVLGTDGIQSAVKPTVEGSLQANTQVLIDVLAEPEP